MIKFFSVAFARHEARVLRANTSTPVFLGFAWALAALLAFYAGGFFATNRAEATVFLGFLPWVFALTLPALTMQGWAEDFKRGLAERMLTLPIGTPALYLTRFVVLWGLVGLWLVGTWPFVAMLFWLGTPDIGALLSGYIGAFMLGGVLLAASLLASVWATNAVASYVLGLVFNGVLLFSGWAYVTDVLTGTAPDMITGFLKNISVLEHYRTFLVGLIDLRSLSFLTGMLLVLLALGMGRLAKRAGRPARKWHGLYPAVAVGLALILATPWLVGWRLDATAARSFTLSPASIDVLKNLPVPVVVHVFDSKTNPDIPRNVRETSRRLMDVLTDIAARSGGKIKLKIINPDASVDAEVQAIQAGIMAQPLPSGEEYFLGLEANMGGKLAAIPALTPERMPYVEFDIMSLLTEVQKTAKKTIAVISSLPLATPDFKPRFMKDLEFQYNVVYLRAGEPAVPADTSALIVAYSPFLSEESLYAIDQYMASGGRTLMLLDPFVRSAIGSAELPEELKAPDRNADALANDHPADVLRAWGVNYSAAHVVADAERAVPVQQKQLGFTTYPLWLALGKENVNADLPFTTFIENLMLSESGFVAPTKLAKGLVYEPVLVSSASSGVVNRNIMDDTPPSLLSSKITGPVGAKDLSALITGPFTSMFASTPASVQQYYADYADTPADAKTPPHNAGGSKNGAVLVVADADFVADDFAITTQNDEQGRVVGVQPKNDNLVFVFNALQYLAGDDALLGLRGKAVASRGFTRINAMLAKKAGEYQRIESKYVAELFTVSQRLAELKARAGQGVSTDASMEQELQTFNVRELKLKKQLREIRKGLRKDVYALERLLLVLNMLLMPVLTFVGLNYLRKRRRS